MKGKKRNNAVGVKGKSGRKRAYEERNKTQAINTLWKKVNVKVQAGEELTEYEEKLVLSILPKTIKTDSNIKIDTPNGLLVEIKRSKDESKESNNGDT